MTNSPVVDNLVDRTNSFVLGPLDPSYSIQRAPGHCPKCRPPAPQGPQNRESCRHCRRTRTTSILPADLPLASLSLTSVKELHLVSSGKKKDAASSMISQSSRNLIGQVMAGAPSCRTLHTPSGFFALSFVQFGTLLLNGHSRRERYRLRRPIDLTPDDRRLPQEVVLVVSCSPFCK